MITFKPCIKYKRADGLYQVYLRVIFKREVRYIITNKFVNDKGIDKKHAIKDNYVLQYCHTKINHFLDMLNKQNVDHWNIDDVIKFIQNGCADISFSDFARKFQADMYNSGHERNAKNYELAYLHLERFAGTNQLMFSHMTSTLIQNWIKSLELTSRAKELYPICIRQIFKAALDVYNDYDQGVIRIKTNPWGKIMIPKADTPQKRAITMDECRNFFYCPLPPSDRILPLAEMGRDVAMMILCLAGINTVDIYNLKKDNYKNGIICYERAKTRNSRKDNAYMEMRVPEIIKPLFNKYLDKTNSEFLLDFHEKYTNSDSFCANVNIGIKQICTKSLNLDPKKRETYCVYTFRHTWATVAQNACGATIAEVGFAMNHSDKNRVTRGYIKINFAPAWELNEKVIDKIFFTTESSNNQIEQFVIFEKFSTKHLMRGTMFFRGEVIAQIEDIGFSNVDQIIDKLMEQLPTYIPSRTMVQFRIENLDKMQKQDYTRTVP